MGWTSISMRQPVKEWFKNSWDNENSDYEVIDSTIVKRMTIYGAIRQKSTGNVFCAVFLIRWSRDEYNFSYKDLTEFAGPCETECPPRIFKLLTPLDDVTDPDGFARKWRERVKVLHDTRKKLSKGYIIKLKEPTSFSNGNEYQYFMRKGQRFYIAKKEKNKFVEDLWVIFNPLKYDYELIENK